MTKGWFGVGYEEGFAGKEERVPEHSSNRVAYRRGYLQGSTDRICQANGKAIVGPVDPWEKR